MKGFVRDKKMINLILGFVGIAIVGAISFTVWRQFHNKPIVLPALKFEVRGGMWINRRNGTSDIQRGTEVFLIRAQIPKAVYVANVENLKVEWTAELKSAEDNLAQEFLASSGRIFTAKNRLADIDKALDQPGDQIDTAKAYKSLKLLAKHESDDFKILESIANVQTDIDGKFLFRDIPQGNYYAHASASGSVFFIEWLVPIYVDRNLAIDLSNANATTIKQIDRYGIPREDTK